MVKYLIYAALKKFSENPVSISVSRKISCLILQKNLEETSPLSLSHLLLFQTSSAWKLVREGLENIFKINKHLLKNPDPGEEN